MTTLIVLIFFIPVVIGILFWILNDIWKERGRIMQIWKKVPKYERKALIGGLILFFVIPMLKGHPAHESYIPAVLIELVHSAAGALFVLGLLSFLKKEHSLLSNTRKEKPNKAN